MKSKTIIRSIAAFLLLLAVSLPAHGQSCGQLCDKGFWHSNPTAAQVEAQIAVGADKEAKTGNGSTPLHRAAVSGTPANIRALVQADADIEAENIFGAPPLHGAAELGKPDTIRALIAGGADLESKDKIGWTPLHRAARYGTAEGIEALLKAKADPMAKTKDGVSVKDLARTNYELTGTKVYDWLRNLPN